MENIDETYEELYSKGDTQAYINEDDDMIIVTNKNGKTLFVITAGSGQLGAYLTLESE